MDCGRLTSEQHGFDLSGATVGDWFLGCPTCLNQFSFGCAATPKCKCGEQMYIYRVTEDDIADGGVTDGN